MSLHSWLPRSNAHETLPQTTSMASLVMDVDMCEGERAGLVEEEQVSQEVDEKAQNLPFEGQVAGGDAAEDRQVSHEVKDQGLPFEGQQVSHEVEEKDQGLPHEGQVVAEEKQVSHEVEEKDQGFHMWVDVKRFPIRSVTRS